MRLTGLLAVIAIGVVGCGQGFKSMGEGGKVDVTAELKKAEEASVEAQEAMVEAQAVVRQISDDKGNINVRLFQQASTSDVDSKVSAQGIIMPLLDKLRPIFDRLFTKITTVKGQFAAARAKLTEALAKLSQSNPQHAETIRQIMEQMSRIDAMEAQFRSQMHSLASKLDIATRGLDRLINGLVSFIPGFGFLVGLALDFLVMSDVRDFIDEIKLRLLTV